MYDAATYFAWFVLALLFSIAVGFIVWIGSLPRRIALGRNHPQIDAINALSWFGLLFGGVGWVVAFVWALVRAAPLGHAAEGDDPATSGRAADLARENESLKARVSQLEKELARTHSQES